MESFIDFAPGLVELPRAIRFVDEAFDEFIPVRELTDADAMIMRQMMAEHRAAFEREYEKLEYALDMRDAEPYLLPLFDVAA